MSSANDWTARKMRPYEAFRVNAMVKMTHLAVEMRDVELSLGSGAARVHILRKISLTIAPGEAVGIIGPSGSGKSTLLMTMAGLERPDAGEIYVGGVAIHSLGEDSLARFRGRNVGVVFQSFQLIATMTALENVAAPLELAGTRNASRWPKTSSPPSD